MPEPKRPLKVFLCHAHADRDPVRGLYARLTQDGVDAWLDKAKLLPGQDWELEIRKAVRDADVVVVCLSKQFNQAGFRQKEVKIALEEADKKPEGEIFIIPARLEECDNLENLRRWHWVDLFEDDGYEMLMRALRTRANKIGAMLQIKRTRSPRIKTLNEKYVKNSREIRMFYDLAAHFECDIENTTPETLANFLLESLTRIMRTVSVVNKNDDNRTVEYRTDQIEYFDPKHGKTIQHALIVHGKKLQLIGKGDFRGVESLTTVLNLLVITITQGVNGSRLRFDSDNIPVESFKELVQGILWDFGKDISVLERAEREAVEKIANEKVEKEAIEKVRLEAEELARQKSAKEKTEREAAEKADREVVEKARLIADQIYEKTNKAINLENSGSLDAALKVYYEIRFVDPRYPNIEKKIQEIENTIRLRKNAEKETDKKAQLNEEGKPKATRQETGSDVSKKSQPSADLYNKRLLFEKPILSIKASLAYGGAILIGLSTVVFFILMMVAIFLIVGA